MSKTRGPMIAADVAAAAQFDLIVPLQEAGQLFSPRFHGRFAMVNLAGSPMERCRTAPR